MTISEDEFAAWRELPITRAFLEKLRRIETKVQEQWDNSMTLSGPTLEERRVECRSRFEFIKLIISMKAKDLNTDAIRNTPDRQERPVFQKADPQRKGPIRGYLTEADHQHEWDSPV